MYQCYYFTEFTFASLLTWKRPKINTTVHILNYNSSFLLDTKSFIFFYFEKLCRTSFKLNAVNSSKALPPSVLLIPLRGSWCVQVSSCILFPNSYKTQTCFPSWLAPWLSAVCAKLQVQRSINVKEVLHKDIKRRLNHEIEDSLIFYQKIKREGGFVYHKTISTEVDGRSYFFSR